MQDRLDSRNIMIETLDASGIAEMNRRYAARPSGPVALAWRWILRLLGQVRRQYLSRLRPSYVARMREHRLGVCRRCGSCCNLTFHCPFLNEELRCRRYEKRTLTCRDFPIDAVDLWLTRVPCGHYFNGPLREKSGANSAR